MTVPYMDEIFDTISSEAGFVNEDSRHFCLTSGKSHARNSQLSDADAAAYMQQEHLYREALSNSYRHQLSGHPFTAERTDIPYLVLQDNRGTTFATARVAQDQEHVPTIHPNMIYMVPVLSTSPAMTMRHPCFPPITNTFGFVQPVVMSNISTSREYMIRSPSQYPRSVAFHGSQRWCGCRGEYCTSCIGVNSESLASRAEALSTPVHEHASDGAVTKRYRNQHEQMPPTSRHDTATAQWNSSVLEVGILLDDGHLFVRDDPGCFRSHWTGARLPPLCLLFEQNLRSYSVCRYRVVIKGGCVGNADGIGFVFGTKILRVNIQTMRSVFINSNGKICQRNRKEVRNVASVGSPLTVGTQVDMQIDLNEHIAIFATTQPDGSHAMVRFNFMENQREHSMYCSSGFFCAVVTKDVQLHLS